MTVFASVATAEPAVDDALEAGVAGRDEALHRGHDVVRAERLAVVPGDALAELERPDAVVAVRRPGLGEARRDVRGFLVEGREELERLGGQAVAREVDHVDRVEGALRPLGGDADRAARGGRCRCSRAGCSASGGRLPSRRGGRSRRAARRLVLHAAITALIEPIERPTIVARLMNSRRPIRPLTYDSTTSSWSGPAARRTGSSLGKSIALLLQRAAVRGDETPCWRRDTTRVRRTCLVGRGCEAKRTCAVGHCQRTADCAILRAMRISRIGRTRVVVPLDPPFEAAWDPVPRSSFPVTIVRVETDEGVVGIGSGDTMDGFEAFEHLFIGEDPLAIARHVRTLETIDFHAGRYWPLEVALWDIAGQVAGLPVATLFGGAIDGIAAYASCGSLLRARGPRRVGPPAARGRLPGDEDPRRSAATSRLASRPSPRRGPRSATRWPSWSTSTRAGGWPATRRPALDPVAAREIAVRLAELDVLWVEEPLDGRDLRGLAGLRAVGARHADRRRRDDPHVPRVARGDRRRRVRRLPARRRARRRDVRVRTIAEVALARDRWFTPHTWTNGIGLLANLHVAAGVGGGPFLEFPYDPPGWTPERRDFLLAEPDPARTGRDPARPGDARARRRSSTRRRSAGTRRDRHAPAADRRRLDRARGGRHAADRSVHRWPVRARRPPGGYVRRRHRPRRIADRRPSPRAAPRTWTERSPRPVARSTTGAGPTSRRRPASAVLLRLAELVRDEPRGAGAARIARRRQADPRHRERGRAELREDAPVVRRDHRQDLWRGRSDRSGCAVARHPRADRCGRGHRALELPIDHHGLEARRRRSRPAIRSCSSPQASRR